MTFIIVSFIYRLGNGRVSFKMKGIKTQGKKKDFAEQKIWLENCLEKSV